MRVLGLIGKTLSYSFSQKYFSQKFSHLKITDHLYNLYELDSIQELPGLIERTPELIGLNVTIPYKQDVLQFIDILDPVAERIGAVNVIRIDKNRVLKGFNSDYFGFRQSLENWVGPKLNSKKSLVFGTGGAAKAVWAVLEDCGVEYQKVSRTKAHGDITYDELNSHQNILVDSTLLINTTPLGTSPRVDQAPDLPYSQLTPDHHLFDLIYNPEESLFLQNGKGKKAKIKNGLEMLELQAEKSWEIWNS